VLKINSVAPDFEGRLNDGSTFRSTDLRGRRNIVLYFYPKDFTPGCTREALAFQENYAEIEQYEAELVGVSADSLESHAAFQQKYCLAFPIIADPERKIIRAFDAEWLFGLAVARVTYVIDKAGVIRALIRHEFAVGRHLPEVLEALRKIRLTG
jgi:peroxiredoxin Q/BCP